MGSKAIAKELGIARNTARRYLRSGGWAGYDTSARPKALAGLDEVLRAEMRKHGNNAEVVRQELARQGMATVGLRTLERAVRPYRELARAEAVATARFETGPGEQSQIDFGERFVTIAGGADKGLLLRPDPWILQADLRPRLHRRAPGFLVRGDGERLPPLRWSDGCRAPGQSQGPREEP